ncbi:kinesin-like protein KIF12 isoform X2 [Bemisia tabaci]|uniref:kinesin-like protein KIF12 isoform X2 n=1 Tax=Bemisia tabaci TaxID=7038 RepID=UPI003B27B746
MMKPDGKPVQKPAPKKSQPRNGGPKLSPNRKSKSTEAPKKPDPKRGLSVDSPRKRDAPANGKKGAPRANGGPVRADPAAIDPHLDALLQAHHGGSPRDPEAQPLKRRSLFRSRSTSRESSPGNMPRSKDSDNGSFSYDFSLGSSTGSLNNTVAEGNADDSINVVVRVRPLNAKEIQNNDPSIISFPGNGQILVEGVSDRIGGTDGNGPKTKQFAYNIVFEPGATQSDVLMYSGMTKLIQMAVEGFSTTAFCYGQTGSGKTHTLTGPPKLFEKNPDPSDPEHGLVFRSFMYLFQLLKDKRDVHFVLKASFLEIYNEKVIDLLNPGLRKPLAVRWSKKSRSFFVENLFTVDCEELDDLLAVLEEGMRNRAMGAHMMNEHSSRSHTILTVHITSEQQMENGVFITKQGKINFVDLAGSEMTKKTHSEGKTLEEANNINKSLMVLGYCIAKLSDPKKKEKEHIPYRDSKLTKLLADSLAGNGVTLMIACISPAKSNVTETLNTLRYAARAKRIKSKPIVVMDPREALIVTLKREVAALQTENEHLRASLNLKADDPIPNVPLSSKTPSNIDLEKLSKMKTSELVDMVKHYANENEALRKENADLFQSRDILSRDHAVVCRENERLLKKLEDANLLPKDKKHRRGSMNPNNADESKMPESVQKELDKRRIGRTLTNFMNNLRGKRNSVDEIKHEKALNRKGSKDVS